MDVTAADGHGSVARQTGLVSGFAASLGGTARALEAFADDPLGFIEGLKQLIALLDDLGVLDRLMEAMAQEFAEKQQQNNPYDEGSALYEEFKYNWYAGYVVGFVAKAAVGSSAAKVAKGTTTYQRVADYVRSSQVGAVYKGVKSPYDRGKARVAATIVDGADRASAPVLRHARSAGATYRLWRLQQKVDVCSGRLSAASTDCSDYFDDLSPTEQRQAARVLGRAGDDGSYVLERLDGAESRERFRIGVTDG